MSGWFWRAVLIAAGALTPVVLNSAAAAQQPAHPHVTVLRPEQASARVDAQRAAFLLQSDANWLRVSHRALPAVFLIYDCPGCGELVRGKKEEQPVLQFVRTGDNTHMYFLWYRDVPNDAMLALTLAQALAMEFGLNLDEAAYARCVRHALAELNTVVSASELRRR